MKVLFTMSFTTATPPKCYTGERRAEYIARRNFYNLTADYNFFTYILNGKKVCKNANAEHYFTREGENTGLFNLQGPMNKEQIAELKKTLKDTKSNIWHGFISFDDVVSRGFNNQENCIKFMRQTFGAFLERAGFQKSNIELYCALHDDTAHRHIHFAFFEKQPMRLTKDGELTYTRRGMISQEAIDNYLVSANMHLDEHGDEYWNARDNAIAEMQRLRGVKERTGFVDGRANAASLILNAEINSLCAQLPAVGRLQYNAENMAVLRPQIDRVAEMLIHSDTRVSEAHEKMLRELARIKAQTEDLAKQGKLGYLQGGRMSSADISAAMHDGPMRNKRMDIRFVDLGKIDYFERLQNDYKARIGNVVLGICKDIKRSETYENRRYVINDKHRKIRAKQLRARRGDLYSAARKAISAVCYQESANFLKSVQQHERDIELEKLRGNAAN